MKAGSISRNLALWIFIAFAALFAFLFIWWLSSAAEAALGQILPSTVPTVIPASSRINAAMPILADDRDLPDSIIRIRFIASELLGFRKVSEGAQPEEYHFSAFTPMMRKLTDRGGIRTIRKAVVKKSSPTGARIAVYAKSRATGSGHNCYTYVADALIKAGIHLEGESAYMAAHQLALCPKVREVKIAKKEQLDSLPRGAIAVWDRNDHHRYGHISISLGNRKEVSDVVRDQLIDYGSSFRVFVPSDMVVMVRQASRNHSGFGSGAASEGISGRIYAELR